MSRIKQNVRKLVRAKTHHARGARSWWWRRRSGHLLRQHGFISHDKCSVLGHAPQNAFKRCVIQDPQEQWCIYNKHTDALLSLEMLQTPLLPSEKVEVLQTPLLPARREWEDEQWVMAAAHIVV